MPSGKRNGKTSKRSRAKALQPSEAPASAVSYRGPIGGPRPDQYVTINFSLAPVQVITDATGDVAGTVTATAVSSCIDWGTLSPNWGEYRVLGFKLEFLPSAPEAATAYPIGFVASVHQDSWSAPGSSASLANMPSKKFVNFGKRWSSTWRMSSIDEAGFIRTNTATNNGGIAWYGDFGPTTTVLGAYTVTYTVQFRAQS